MAILMKPAIPNIINLWFGADTPIRQFKIKHNLDLWEACQRINQVFRPASEKRIIEQYRKSDKVAFARSVLQEINRSKVRPSFGQKIHSPA